MSCDDRLDVLVWVHAVGPHQHTVDIFWIWIVQRSHGDLLGFDTVSCHQVVQCESVVAYFALRSISTVSRRNGSAPV